MTVLFSDTFPAANGTAWDASKWTVATAGATVDQQSGSGRIALAGVTGGFAELGSGTSVSALSATNFELTCDIQMSNVTAESYAVVSLGTGFVNADGTQADGYSIVMYPGVGTGVEFSRYTSAVKTTLVSDLAFSLASNVVLHIKYRREDDLHSVRLWQGAATEPTTWKWQVIDATWITSTHNFVGFAYINGTTAAASENYDVNFVSVSDLVSPTKVQQIGTATATSAATTTAISFAGATKPQIGDTVIVYGSRNNATNDPATGDSFSDANGNTYTVIELASPSGTSTAAAGIVGVLAYSILTVAWPSGTNTLTWTHPSVAARAVLAEHWQNLASFRSGSSASAGSTAGAVSVTTGATSPVAGDLVVAMAAYEYSSAGTITGDADTTGGPWDTVAQIASAGTTLAAVKVATQHKLTSATGAQTFNPTHSVTTSVDVVGIILAFVPASTSASANLGTATSTATAYNLVSSFTETAAVATASAFPQGSTRNTVVATGAVSAFNLAAIQSLIAASSTATAFALSVPGGAVLAATVSTVSAFPQSSTRNTTVATGTISAFNLTAIQSLIAANSTAIAFNLAGSRSTVAATATATANNLSATSPASATAAVATATVSSFNLSGSRSLGFASPTAIANVLGYNSNVTTIYAQVQATGLDLQNVLIGAEPFGSGRTPTAAVSTATAYNLSYTDSITLVQAAATAAAQFLSRTTFLPTTANVAAVAFGIVNLILAQSANASAVAGDVTGGLRSPVGATATTVAWNPHNQFYGTLAAIASAVAFGGPSASSVSTFALATTLAYSLGNNSLVAFAATGLANAFPLSAGDVLSYASVSVLAQNLGLTSSPVLSGATASAGAFPLNVTPTSSMSVANAGAAAAGLGTADALSAASSGAAAGPLAGTRQETAATAPALAYGLIGASSPLLAGASALATAYGLGNLTLAAGTMAAAVATVLAFNPMPFIRASLGQAPATASAFLLSELGGSGTNSSTATTSAFGMGRGLTPYVATVNTQANGLLNRALLSSSFASADASAYGLTVFAVQPGLGKVHSGVGGSGVHTGVGTSYGVHAGLVS